MGLVGRKSLERLSRLNDKLLDEIEQDAELPESMKAMISLHLSKPWIPGHVSLAISPLRDGLDSYHGPEVFEWQGAPFFFPGPKWWLAHGKSHPPEGAGCDLKRHTEYLTPEGKSAEWAYAAILRGGSLRILNREDFKEECSVWAAAVEREEERFLRVRE